jgi:hypothetical protein
MAAMPQPQPDARTLPDISARTGVTLRVDFATGKILGPVDPQDIRLRRAERTRETDLTDLPRRRAR